MRVLNASWGQSGSALPELRTAIDAAGAAGILFVAAAGNGNILGQGINLDRQPFYPASYGGRKFHPPTLDGLETHTT